MKQPSLMCWLASGSLSLFTTLAHAGGPLNVCRNAPVKYPGAGAVTLNYDQGALGSRTKAQADALITAAISVWHNGATTTVTLARGADMPVDVTAANYATYVDNFSDGRNPVIYDTDGSITDLIFGVGAKNATLGFADSGYSGTDCQYGEGQAVINGFISVSDISLQVAVAHEIGHLIGMDHTQLNTNQGLTQTNFPLMYPVAFRNTLPLSLHEDDAAAVSALYPASSLNSVYGQLSGTFTQASGTPILGANIWAREIISHKVYSAVSDYLTQGTGYFRLLLPAGTYDLHAEAILKQFTGGSGVGPYAASLADSSFQPPLYDATRVVAMTPVTLGAGTPSHFVITAGCSASIVFRIDGTGSPSSNCLVAPPDCLFNWAERTYPGFFTPAGATSSTLAPYYYRYYPQTNSYLGTSSADNHVYYLGPLSSNSFFDEGALSGWLSTAGCQ
jgi:hypothetical protein